MSENITAQLSTETADDLQQYLDNASIAMHKVQSHGIIVWANKAELDLFGYSASEYVGHHVSEFHVDTIAINHLLKRLSNLEKVGTFQSAIKCKDGTVRLVEINLDMSQKNGSFIHYRGITSTLQQKDIYRKVIEVLPAAVYTTNTEGKIQFYNRAAAELWGREPELGKDLWCGSSEIYNPDGTFLPLEECPMAITLKEGRTVNGQHIIIKKPDGTSKHVAPYPELIFDESGSLVGAVNMLMDITAIKETEQALVNSEKLLKDFAITLEKSIEEKTSDLNRKNEELKKSEQRYHKMIEEVEDYAILLMSKDGIIENWNRGAEKIKGYKENEIVGRHFEAFYPPENKLLARELIKQAIIKGKAVDEGWRVRKDGSRFWASVVITALHDQFDNVIGFSKVTRDLTERKTAEDKLRDYSSELEFQNKELEQFAYAASHDMKEPIRKLHLYNTYILDNSADLMDNKSREFLFRSIKAVKRMSNLIDDLLSYSRTTITDERFEPVDLNELINDLEVVHKEEFELYKVQIIKENLPVVKAVPFQMKQLMDNLINNSLKYSHPDRPCNITITGKTVAGTDIADEEAENEKEYFKLIFADNGIGFDSQYSKKIFEIFQRLDNHPNAKGSGIGLSICKRIVQNHKGFINATGIVNQGASFDIYLPKDS